MQSIFEKILKWSEVWPFLIPLAIFFIYKTTDKRMLLVVWYLIISFFILLVANYISYYTYRVPEVFKNNNILYNISAFIRTMIIGIYLIYHPRMRKFKFLRYLLAAYLVLAIVVFSFFDPILNISTTLFAATSILLLVTSLTYFLNTIIDDEESITYKDPAFMISAGVSLFESINFFIYLFF